ncbi:MAG: PAS domain S-box protein [Candidatus Sumerlaeota bacterium]
MDGHSYLMRTLPYHLDKRTVSGTVVTFINIDELKSAMTALAESEEHFRLFFETTPELVHVTKYATGEIGAVNQVFLDQMGYKREDVIGKTTLELGEWPNPDSRKAFLEMLNAEGHVRNMQGNYRDKKGHEHPWLLSAKSIQLDGQKHILAIARDISELRETQRDLRLSEAFINVALDAGKVALWDVNLETGEVTTRGLLEMLGFEPEDVPENLAGWMADLVHPDDREDVDEKIRKCTSGEIEKYSTDHRLRKKDGTDLWVYAAGKLFKDAHKVQHLIGTSVDVTPRYSKMKEKLEDK